MAVVQPAYKRKPSPLRFVFLRDKHQYNDQVNCINQEKIRSKERSAYMAYPTKTDNRWHVVVSSTIHYKKATDILERLGFSFYIPIQNQLRYWSDRKKWIKVPILNPYIFLFTNEIDRKLLFQSSSCFQFLSYGGKLAIAREDEIERIKALCNYSSAVRLEQQPIKQGDLVEVIGGPFAGMSGYALQENGKHRLVVSISSLGQFASVDIDSSWLRAC